MRVIKELLTKIVSGKIEHIEEFRQLVLRIQQLDMAMNSIILERNKLMADSQPFTWINMPSQGRFLIREKDKYEKNYINGCANNLAFNS